MSDSPFHKLRKINVNDKTEKKSNLTYLSWAWAVDQLLENDPAATWEYHEPQMFGDTMMVSCTVTAFGKQMREYLPVLDYKNRAVLSPDAMAVNTSMKRCLAKCIALHGLGLYIYAGEDLPPDEQTAEQEREVKPQLSPTAQTKSDINALDDATQTLIKGFCDKWTKAFDFDKVAAYDIYLAGMAEVNNDATAQSAMRGLVTDEQKKAFGTIKRQRDNDAANKHSTKEAA